MAECPEASEKTCSFIRILEPDDYNGDEEIMRALIHKSVAHGKSVLIRGYRTVAESVKFNAKSLEKRLNVWPEMLIDTTGKLSVNIVTYLH